MNSLRPINPDNARGPRITAAAGTKLAAPYSCGTIISFSHRKVVYVPKDFFLHAASLPQPFGHWGRFLTAASRRSLGSVSVPVRRVMLSHPLSVVALVGFYPTNKLMSHRPLSDRINPLLNMRYILSTSGISPDFSRLCPSQR